MTAPAQSLYRYVHRIPNPAVGAEIAISPDRGMPWRACLLYFELTTSAVAGNRRPHLRLSDGTNRIWQTSAPVTSGPGVQVQYSAFPGAPFNNVLTLTVNLFLPNEGLIIEPGFVLSTLTDAIDVGDQYANVALFVEELAPDPQWSTMPEGAPYFHPVG